MLGQATIEKIAAALKQELTSELRSQGHHLTGALEESILAKMETGALEVFANDYINPVNAGVPAANIPFDSSQRTGAGHSKYIEGLMQYAKLRFGLSDKEALRAAFAIAKKHEKEGMPTVGSYQYSENKRRTEALENVFEDTLIDRQVEQGISDELDSLLEMNKEVII